MSHNIARGLACFIIFNREREPGTFAFSFFVWLRKREYSFSIFPLNRFLKAPEL